MKIKKTAKKLGLSESDLKHITEAVAKAEQATNGEIALAAVPASSDYTAHELLFSIFFGGFVLTLLLPFHQSLYTFIADCVWLPELWMLPALYGFISFFSIGLAFVISNFECIDRLIISKKDKSIAVYNRALRHFVESGVYATQERTGILLFVSLLEREVRILADSGIASHIPQEEWNLIADNLAIGIKKDQSVSAFVEAIEQCGNLLSKHFPQKEHNPNELPDGLIFPEDP